MRFYLCCNCGSRLRLSCLRCGVCGTAAIDRGGQTGEREVVSFCIIVFVLALCAAFKFDFLSVDAIREFTRYWPYLLW